MKIVAQFDPTATQFSPIAGSGPFGIIQTGIAPGDGKIMVFNQSLVNLVLTFSNTGFVDYVPAGTYRYFEMSLPNWNIAWSSNPGFVVEVNNISGLLSSEVSLVTVVSYQPSEQVPTIEPATSFINPYNSQVYIGPDNQSTTFTGTAANLFTLSSAAVPGTTTYLSHIVISAVQTASGSDHADLNVTITGITNFGGAPHYIMHLNNLNNATYPIPWNPPLPANAVGTSINIVGTLTNVAGAGISSTCAISAFFYHV